MVETISPVVYGTRARWLGAVLLHAVGAAATAAAFGAAVAAAGALLGAPWGRAGAVAVVVVASIYAAREFGGLRIPVPQLRRQVPDWWRTYFGKPLAAVLYGAGLGVGFLTYLGHGTLVVVTVGAAATGRPALGALALVPFGVARGLSPLVAASAEEREDGRALVDRLSEMPVRTRALVNGVAIVAVALSALAVAASTDGGWSRASIAVVAVAFGWAAVAKLAGTRRWRRALAEHRLSPRLTAAATWAVPLAELAVPGMVVLGRERAAAALAAALLAVFSAALVRARLLVGGRRVPCGCYGRDSVDVRAALARNALLAALAAVAWAAAGSDPPLRLPAGSDVLPASLVAASVAAAALTAWRASVWFSRARG